MVVMIMLLVVAEEPGNDIRLSYANVVCDYPVLLHNNIDTYVYIPSSTFFLEDTQRYK